MVATAATEARRGRPRNEACTTDILTATLDLVAEVGIAALTVDAVAARAGVGKATIYRRWSSKEALMLDAWASCVRPPEVPDTGSLADDLRALLGRFDSPLQDRDLQRVFPQMIAAARVKPEVADQYREFIAQRRIPMRTVLERAAARGEIDGAADLGVVHDLLVAPLLYRWLISDEPIDAEVIDGVIALVLDAVRPR
jgi:AcrR family transcriptional regulator